MEVQDWIFLKLLNKYKNITKTAERMHVSQPALTKRLQQIETEFGVQIVHRERRGIYFTPQGEHLVKYADDMLKRYREVKEELWNLDHDMVGTLRLGATNFFTRYKLPGILKLFKSKYPRVEIDVTINWSKYMHNLLYNRDIHVGFIRGDYDWSEQKHLLFQETLTVASKDKITLDDLPHLPRIDYETDSGLTTLIHKWWTATYSVPPLIGMVVDRADTCKEMVLHGLGYTIVPSLVLTENDDLYKINLADNKGEPILRNTWMLYSSSSLELKIVNEFVKFIKELDFVECL